MWSLEEKNSVGLRFECNGRKSNSEAGSVDSDWDVVRQGDCME